LPKNKKGGKNKKIQTWLLGKNNFFGQKNNGGMGGKEVTGVIREEEQQNFLKDKKITKQTFRRAP
jgi:hypothetical protein